VRDIPASAERNVSVCKRTTDNDRATHDLLRWRRRALTPLNRQLKNGLWAGRLQNLLRRSALDVGR